MSLPPQRVISRASRPLRRALTAPSRRVGRTRPVLERLEERKLLTGEPKFISPLGGVAYRDWTIDNYVDLNPMSAAQDYRGGPYSYHGHTGLDIALANFASMDGAVPVYAAAAGIVTYTHDGEPDRNTDMPDVAGNELTIEHGGGWLTFYGHFRTNTVAVVPGQSVAAGDFLGLAGSSGHSTAAHLHFEVQHDGIPVETYLDAATFWVNPIPYSGDSKGALDFGIADHVPGVGELGERPAEREVFPQTAGQPITFWAVLHGIGPGDTLTARWFRPSGASFSTSTWVPGTIRRAYWTSTVALPSVPDLGTWQATYEINGIEVARSTFRVATATAPEVKVSLYSNSGSNIVDGTTTAVDFGTAAPGRPGPTRTFTVRNTGNATLNLGTPTLPAGFTLVEGLNASLAPYATEQFTVRMDTAAVGTKSGQISFSTNDADENPFNFSIQGVVAHTPTVFTVTNTNASGPGSLADAVFKAGAASLPATVVFQIPTSDPNYIDVDSGLPGGDGGPDVFVIRLKSALTLNNLAGGTTLDGASQTTFTGNTNPFGPEIVIDGSLAPYGYGVEITTNGNRLSNLTVQNFPWSGVRITGDSNVVTGTYIGTNATGTSAAANANFGIVLDVGAQGNRIGTNGDGINDLAERNVISGNGWSGVNITGAGTDSNVIAGNIIGLNAAGTAALGNLSHGVWINAGARANRIGSNGDGVGDAAERNVISANNWDGVSIGDSGTLGNLVAGNDIGTNIGGTVDLGNAGRGVFVYGGATTNTVGGTTTGARNVISGNNWDGVVLYNAGTSSNVVLGNYIGTAANGTADLGNASAGVFIGGGASGNTVGGVSAGARNVISGNDGAGVGIYDAGTSANKVLGNYIGTNAAGTAALGNAYQGVVIASGASNNTVGGTSAGSGNVLSGNVFDGVSLFGTGTNGNLVQGNLIGTDKTGTAALGNGSTGVYIDASSTTVGGAASGAANTIAFNGGSGVYIYTGTGNVIRRNAIHSNTYLGIDLAPGYVTPNDAGDVDTGPNGLQNFPVLTSATSSGASTTVVGTLGSKANTTYVIEFFSSPVADPSGYGEGRTFLGDVTVTTNGSGTASFTGVLGVAVLAGQFVTSTATDPLGNTSEFSATRTVTGGVPTLSINDVTVTEGDSGTVNATFTVTLSASSSSSVTVQFATADGTASQLGDYTATIGTLTFVAGQVSRTISVPIKGDLLFEPTETFTLNLSSPTNATIADGQGIGTILDNDTAPATTDIRMLSATADGATILTVSYQVVNAVAAPFSVGFYRSTDAAFGGDTLLSTVSISLAADLIVGTHTKAFTIGSTSGQIKFPGIGATELDTDDFLLAVADPTDAVTEQDADPLNEDNTVVFVGTYHPASGAVYVQGSANADVITIATSGSNIILTVNGVSLSYAAGAATSFRVRSHGGDDTIDAGANAKPLRAWGGTGNDLLLGGLGGDTLEGGAGDDTMTGGAGNDIYVFRAAVGTEVDTVVEFAAGGTDRLDFAALASSSPLTVNLTSDIATAAHAGRTVKTGAAGQAANLENATGGAGNDSLTGNAVANTLEGGAGDDTMAGGAGNDVYLFRAAVGTEVDTVVELAAGGTDRLDFAALLVAVPVTVNLGSDAAIATHAGRTVNTGAAGQAANFENATGGAGNDSLTGNAVGNVLIGGTGNDALNGGLGNDTLEGGAGDDTMTGGTGDDVYLFRAAVGTEVDTVVELAAGGTDRLDFAALLVAVPVTVNLASDAATATHAGRTVKTAAAGQAANLENATGGAGNDSLTGNALANVLEGGAGDDTLTGGAGNDIYVFRAAVGTEVDTVVEFAAGGTDRLDFAALLAAVAVTVNLGSDSATATHAGRTVKTGAAGQAANFENATGGAGNDSLTGNAAANELSGGAGNDTLVGGPGDDSLTGGAGNDTLDGGTGNDTAVGGAGNDVYIFGAAAADELDMVVELASGGIDRLDFTVLDSSTPVTVNLTNDSTLASHANRTLRTGAAGQAANFEQVFGGAGNDILVGNVAANVLVGNGGDDSISGGAGFDLLIGGAGADLLDGGTGDDLLIGGRTSYDIDFAALDAILAEWSSADLYATKISKLQTGAISGGYRLDATTIITDTVPGSAAQDTLTGGVGRDWFLTHSSDIVTDQDVSEIKTAF